MKNLYAQQKNCFYSETLIWSRKMFLQWQTGHFLGKQLVFRFTQKIGFLFIRGLSHYLEESFCERYVSFIPHCKIHILRPKTIMENKCHINPYSSYFENAFGLAKNSHNQINWAKKVSTSFWYKKEPWPCYKSVNDSMWKGFLWLVSGEQFSANWNFTFCSLLN